MIILVDLDGVCADLEGHMYSIVTERHPEIPLVPRAERNTFYIEDQIGKHHGKVIGPIMREQYFFENLPVIEGAVEGVLRLAKDHQVFFCSSPVTSPWCVMEKLSWVERHFGRKWLQRTFIGRDKTLVRGHILIDDRPEVKGLISPDWVHILYDQPYNRDVPDKQRITWEKVIAGDGLDPAIDFDRVLREVFNRR